MGERPLYIRLRGKVMGPFGDPQLRVLRDRGQFSSFHEISEDRRIWTSAAALPGFFGEPTTRRDYDHPSPSGVTTSHHEVRDVSKSRTPVDWGDNHGPNAGHQVEAGSDGRRGVICPSCDSENVQSLKVIYELGTSDVSSISYGTMGGGGMLFGTAGTHQSRAAQNATPPKEKDLAGPIIAIIFGVAAICLGVAALTTSEPSTAVIPLGIGIVLAACGGAAASQANKWNAEQYPGLRQIWLNSFRCLKCGEVFRNLG